MNSSSASACDVLVIGSGAGGLSAAITARWHGLDVLVVEKEVVFGGTTAWSGGWLWIPRNPLVVRAGIADSVEAARTYLQHELGHRFRAGKVDAFLDTGPKMVEFFTGEGLNLAEAVGAQVDESLSNAAAWVPVSTVPYGDGHEGIFPHLVDRAKPGVIAVTANGRRFVNEAGSHHDLMQALFHAVDDRAEAIAFLLCDHRVLRKYGLGLLSHPAMTFGYIAGRHIAGVTGDKPGAQEMGAVPSPADDQDHHIALPAKDQFARVAELLTIRR